MDINELFRQLSVLELSNLAASSDLDSGDSAGTISSANQQKVVLAANDGLMKLYTRFLIKTGDLVIKQQEGQMTYPLRSKRVAVSQEAAYPGATWAFFIQDSAEAPFQEDVIKILEVYDGCEVVLDDLENCASWFRPQADVLQIPNPVADKLASVMYQAAHPVLGYSDLTQELEIPDCLLPGLRAFIAASVFTAIGGQENMARGAGYLESFETICLEAQAMNLVTTPDTLTNTRFAKRGWC